MPVIRNAVSSFFAKAPLADIDPDKVVAIGAGIQADVLIGNKSADNFLLLDVNPLSLGIETMGELVEKIIPRNTTIPVAKAQEFTTFKDGQTGMSLHVVQGERELVSDCRSLARFELRAIPPMVAGAAKIRVTFQVDADGLLTVAAEELSTNSKAEIQIKPSYGLNAEAIEQMLESSRDNATADMESRSIKEAQLEATQLIDALASASKADGDLLNKEEATRIDAAVARLQSALSDGSSNQIHALCEELNHVSGDFAARRMDLHIGNALRGHLIDAADNSIEN
jgi:molecular chaperone HscA